MNLAQFLQRWPAKDSRLFFFAGGKDFDRLPVYYSVCDRWRKVVDRVDFVRLHRPTLIETAEALRQDPVASRHRVVCATEAQWPPDEYDGPAQKKTADRQRSALLGVVADLPRDTVLILSTSTDSPKTDNDLAQTIIRKGYWTVLKPTDEPTAAALLHTLTGWEPEFCREAVSIHGTSPSGLLSLARTVRQTFDDPTEDDVRAFLASTQRGHVFELTEAIVQKDLIKALALSASDDVPTGQLVGALDRKLTTLLSFIAEIKRGRTPKDAAMGLKLPGFLVHGLFEASKRWTSTELVQTWPLLAQCAADGDRPGGTDLLIAAVLGV